MKCSMEHLMLFKGQMSPQRAMNITVVLAIITLGLIGISAHPSQATETTLEQMPAQLETQFARSVATTSSALFISKQPDDPGPAFLHKFDEFCSRRMPRSGTLPFFCPFSPSNRVNIWLDSAILPANSTGRRPTAKRPPANTQRVAPRWSQRSSLAVSCG